MTIEEFENLIASIEPDKRYDFNDYSYYKSLIPEGLMSHEYEYYCRLIANRLGI